MALPAALRPRHSALTAGLLILRLTTVGVAGIMLYTERLGLALAAIGVAAVTAVMGTWHHRLLPLCHVLATGVWSGCMVFSLWHHYWVMAANFALLCGIETFIARMEVKTWTSKS